MKPTIRPGFIRNSSEYAGVVLAVILALPILAAMVIFARPLLLVGIPLLILAVALVPALRRRFAAALEAPGPGGLRLPAGVQVGRFHSWVRPAPSGEVLVGVDDLMQRTLGPVTAVHFPRREQSIRRGDPLFELGAQDRSLMVRSPLSGRILEVNRRLDDQPNAINESPYDEGWVVRLAPSEADERALLRQGSELRQWFAEDIGRVTAHLSPQLLPTASLADGGELASDLDRLIDGPTWKRIRTDVFGDGRPS